VKNDLAIYLVEAEEWRFGSTESGIPYVIAQDIAKPIGYRDAHDAVQLLDDDEYGTASVRTRSSNGVDQWRDMLVIYEDGIW